MTAPVRRVSFALLAFSVSCSVGDHDARPEVRVRIEAEESWKAALSSYRGLGVTVLPKTLAEAPATHGTAVSAFGSRDAGFADVMLALFKDSSINLMMEGDMPGTATFDIKASTLEETFEQLLGVYDLAYRWDGNFLRVGRKARRTFLVDYPANDGSGGGATMGAGGSSSPGKSGASSSGSSGGTASGAGAPSGGIASSGGGAQAFWSSLTTDVKSLVGTDADSVVFTNTTLGSITVDAKPSSVRKVAEYLDHARKRATKQVSLEARVLEVSLNRDFKFGVNYSLLPGLFHTSNQGTLAGGAIAIGSATSGETTAQIGYLSPNHFSIFYDALESQGQVRVLSSPRVSTLNNISASIRVVEQVPVIEREIVETTGVSRTQFNVRFVDAGITVNVTPQIGEDGVITAVVEPSIIEVSGFVRTPDGLITEPILNTRNLRTIVKVQDGQALVMGGLRSTRRNEELNKIPLLGDIPGLGMLFRSTSQSKAETEIVIVIYPRVLTPEWEKEDFDRGVDRVMKARVPFVASTVAMEEQDREWTKDHLDGRVPPTANGVDRARIEPPAAKPTEEPKKTLSRQGLSHLAFLRAYDRLERGEALAAQQDLEDALANDPANAAAWFVKGVLALRAGRLAEAQSALSRASTLAPGDASVLNALGLAELRLDEAVTAEGRFRAALAQSNLPELHNNLGIALLAQGSAALAENEFRAALADAKAAPAEAHVNLAASLDQQGKGAEALASYRAFLLAGGNPRDPRLKGFTARFDAAIAATK